MKDYFEIANVIRTQEKLLGDKVIHCRNLDSSITNSEIIDREIQNGYDYIKYYLPEYNIKKESKFDDFVYTSENNGYIFFHLSISIDKINLINELSYLSHSEKFDMIKNLLLKIDFLEFELYSRDNT